MAVIGYFEGTNPETLTRLAVQGVETIPLSNGFDHHGKPVGHLTEKDGVRLVMGHLHKVVPAAGVDLTVDDILYNCKVHRVPVLLIVPEADQGKARERLGDMGEFVQFVEVAKLYDRTLELIKD